jgi:hypothetical protein
VVLAPGSTWLTRVASSSRSEVRGSQRDSTALNQKPILDNVTCARLPADSLAALAKLRGVAGISVLQDGDRAWVFWEQDDDRVLRSLLPAPNVELYERRGDTWFRAGRQLPSFDMPPAGEPISLDQAVTPGHFEVEPAWTDSIEPLPLRLVRDDHPRATTAALCPMVELRRWADSAPSVEFAAIRGAVQGEMALLMGRSLPPWPGATRYWGQRVLIPIGFRLQPSLPEDAVLQVLAASGEDVYRVIPQTDDSLGLTVEAISLDSFRVLSRAGVRLTRRTQPS